jgi:hypothetical protein
MIRSEATVDDDIDMGLQIVKILVSHGCKANQDILNPLGVKWFMEAGLEQADYVAGVEAALKFDWITQRGSPYLTFKMTTKGVTAATRFPPNPLPPPKS